MSVHPTGHTSTVTTYIQRRNKGSALLPERWRRQYNVWSDDGFGFSVSLSGLDTLLDARRYPADFWACVQAADRAFKAGDLQAVFEWPSGRRLPQAPTGAQDTRPD
jgi:hypothetical protein